MKNCFIDDNPSYEMWNDLLDEFGVGNLQQTFEYSEAAKEANPHTRTVRFLVEDGDTSVGLVQALYNKRFGLGDWLKVGGTYGYGPVISQKVREAVLVDLLKALEEYGAGNRVPEALVAWPAQWGLHEVFQERGYSLKEEFNVYKVGLGESSEDLFSRISRNKRKNIRKAQSSGLEVSERKNMKDLDAFYEMLAITGKRSDFIPPSYDYFKGFFNVFGPIDRARVFMAYWKGEPVAGVFVVSDRDTGYALGAGSLEEAWPVRPNDILHWEAMNWCRERGLSYYHMGYVSQPPPGDENGLWRWKKEWGGRLEGMHSYNKVYKPMLKRLVGAYEKAYKIVR